MRPRSSSSTISFFDRVSFFEADSPQEEEVKAVVRRNSIQVKHEISILIRARAEIIERLAKEKEVLQTEQDRKVETDARLVMVQGQLESAVKKRDAPCPNRTTQAGSSSPSRTTHPALAARRRHGHPALAARRTLP